MAKYRKKPVVIDAWQLPQFDAVNITCSLPEWLIESVEIGDTRAHKIDGSDMLHLTIKTLEGDHLARPLDWIIKGVNGELYPCKPEIFAKTYDAVEVANG